MALSLKEDPAFKTGYEVKLGIGDVKMSIFFRPAAKFDARADRVKYFHLNLEFESSVPERATGIFAELAGTRELSHATRALLKTPPKAVALSQHSQCLCPPPAPPPPPKENTVVVDSFVVSGSVDDYTDADRDALTAEYANVTGVDPSVVALYMTAGSVRMTFYICHGSTETALETMADVAELVHEFGVETGKTMVAESKPQVFIGTTELADVFCDCTGETCQTKTDVHDAPLAAPPTAPLAAPPAVPGLAEPPWAPSVAPTSAPADDGSAAPTAAPADGTAAPTAAPADGSAAPTAAPTAGGTAAPTAAPADGSAAAPTTAPTAAPYADPTVVDKADVTLKTEITGRCSDKVLKDFDWSGKKGLVADSFESKVGMRPHVTVRCDEGYRQELKKRGGDKASAVQVDGLIIESEWVSLNESSYEKLEEEEKEEFSDGTSATTFLSDAGVKAIEVDGVESKIAVTGVAIAAVLAPALPPAPPTAPSSAPTSSSSSGAPTSAPTMAPSSTPTVAPTATFAPTASQPLPAVSNDYPPDESGTWVPPTDGRPTSSAAPTAIAPITLAPTMAPITTMAPTATFAPTASQPLPAVSNDYPPDESDTWVPPADGRPTSSAAPTLAPTPSKGLPAVDNGYPSEDDADDSFVPPPDGRPASSAAPTAVAPITLAPTSSPTSAPTSSPTSAPTKAPTAAPTSTPASPPAPPGGPPSMEACAYDRRPNGVIKIQGELSLDQCMEECFLRGAPSWSYLTKFGRSREEHHQGSVHDGLMVPHEPGSVNYDDATPTHEVNETIALPKCLCANPSILLGFVDDPDYHTYSLAGSNRMPENYLDAGILNPDSADFPFECKIACLKMNSSLWYSVWNQYGAANYGGAGEETRCRCSDPDPGDDRLSSQLVEDPGYDTFSLAGPHKNLRPFHKIDAFDLDDDECIRHCSVESPGSTWVALWNPIGEMNGALNAGMLSINKRCLCEDTSKEYELDDDPTYDLYSLRGEC